VAVLATSTDAPFSQHVLQRTVVLPELKVLFLPVPKAGCTSILWRLAELAGIPAERFAESPLAEPTPALTVHDMAIWEGHRLADRDEAERERLLAEDGWLRFTVVREPGRRLWSAWASKLLLREPRFVETFGSEPWFPRIPQEPAALVEDFRAFVQSGAEDVHWGVQHDLVSQLPLNHVGHVERLDETLERLTAHHAPLGDIPRANRSRIPLAPGAYDEAAAATLLTRYAADYEAFGYEPAAPTGDPGWDVAPLLPLLRDLIDQNERIGQLHRLARRPRKPPPERKPDIVNLEDEPDFHVRWAWADGPVKPGFTGVLRVKDESASLPWVLPPLLRAVERVVMIDNGSTDGSQDLAREVAAREGAADRFEVLDYPFSVSRCGPEHLGTAVDSVHSLAHFYNWSFSHVRTSYALKWDGDMVLTDGAVAMIRDLSWQLEGVEAVVRIPRHALYLESDRRGYLDTALRNREPWGWPNGPAYTFVKAFEWELPRWPEGIRTVALPEWGCIELKHLDADEFAHWSQTDFTLSGRTQRKKREWDIFQAKANGTPLPEGLIEITAPEGVHVVDHVRETWMPERAARGE
jgi:Sulfotransferase family